MTRSRTGNSDRGNKVRPDFEVECLQQPLWAQRRRRQTRPSRLPISEQSIVFLVGKDLEDQDHGANTRCRLNRVEAPVCERQLKPPRVREGRRKTAMCRELKRNPTLRNLVSREHVVLQARDPPPELFLLFWLKLRIGGTRARSQPDLACGETGQVNEPPTSPRPSRTRARRSESTSRLSNPQLRSSGACSDQSPVSGWRASSFAVGDL